MGQYSKTIIAKKAIMSKGEAADREKLKNLRTAIQCHMEDGAMLFQQLPEAEHDYYLANCVAAWELVATEPLTPEALQRMIEALFSHGDDDIEEISGTRSGEAA